MRRYAVQFAYNGTIVRKIFDRPAQAWDYINRIRNAPNVSEVSRPIEIP